MSLLTQSAVAPMIRMQALAGIVSAIALALLGQVNGAVSLLCGVGLMIINAAWLASRLDKTRGMDIDSGRRHLYSGAALRFIALIVGLVLANLAGLHLLWVAGGMFLAQAVVFVSAVVGIRREHKGGGLG